MKPTVAILMCLVAAASAQFGQYNTGKYNPFGNQYRYKPYSTPAPFRYRPVSVTPSPTFAPTFIPAVTTPAPVYSVPVSRVSTDARNAEIVKYGNEINPDGSFNYFYETTNGIAAQAQGIPRDFGGNPPVVPDVIQGSFSWVAPDGHPYSITYTADENGYQPQGIDLPTPPPVPAQIARALEYTAKYIVPQKK